MVALDHVGQTVYLKTSTDALVYGGAQGRNRDEYAREQRYHQRKQRAQRIAKNHLYDFVDKAYHQAKRKRYHKRAGSGADALGHVDVLLLW